MCVDWALIAAVLRIENPCKHMHTFEKCISGSLREKVGGTASNSHESLTYRSTLSMYIEKHHNKPKRSQFC